jgi:hypothetical protein
MVTLIANANAQNKFDGTWSVVLATNSGPCERTYSGRVQVINSVVHFSGGGLSGRVTARGAVSVTASMGAGWGVASGQLSTNSGQGTWRSQADYTTNFGGSWRSQVPCSGSWNAQKE